MNRVLWTGRLSLLGKLMVNTNNIVAWVTRRGRDAAAMKERVKQGFEGRCAGCLARSEDLGSGHFSETAAALVDLIDVTEARGSKPR